MTSPEAHDRQEAQAVEIVLAVLAGLAVFGFVLLAAWVLARVGVPATPGSVLLLIAGTAGIASSITRLIQAKRAGL